MQLSPPDNGFASVMRPALRQCSRWTVATLGICLLLIAASPAIAHESEQYTLPAGRDFADLGPYFTKIVYDSIVGAVADTNAAIAQAIEGGESRSQIDELQSADFIAGKVWQYIFAAIPANELLDATLASDSVQSQYPGLVTMYRPTVSIYDDPLLVIDLTKVVRTFFRAGSVSAGGVVVGTDKIIHFINIGRIYHSKYEVRIKRGLPENEAIKSAIASTSRNPLTSEDGVLGMWTTGIHSNGDLAADYAGLMFYRNLTESVRIGSRELPSMLMRDGPYWRVRIEPDSDFFVAFITPHWNEVLNPNKYVGYTGGRIRTLVRERCPLAMEWYRDPHGQPRGREQFVAIEQELATYYGSNYGHESNPTHPVTIADTCFPKGTASAKPASDDKVKVAAAGPSPGATGTRDVAGSAAAPGPDALGRTPLWWAARDGDAERVQVLAATRSEIDRADVDGETPLHAATRAGSVTVVRELLDRGANPDRAAQYGVTPLMLAVASGRMDVAIVLLQAGVNPNSRDMFGTTALHVAAMRGNVVLTNRLLREGANPLIVDDGGNTALHLAARRGNKEVVSMLMARGADANARNNSGATPRDEAGSQGHASTAEQMSLDVRAPSSPPLAGKAPADAAVAYRASAPPGDTAVTPPEGQTPAGKTE